MQARQLSDTLNELRDILVAAGVKDADLEVGGLARWIGEQGGSAEEAVAKIAQALDPAQQRRVAVLRHVGALTSAGFDEGAFKGAFAQLSADKQVGKDEMLDVAKALGVIRIEGKSRKSYLESIEKYFYWALYNRDANEMARRATPW